MECKNCGKEIPDGFEYCQECEEKMQEEKVFTISKGDLKISKDKKRMSQLSESANRSGRPVPQEGVAIDLEGYGKALLKDLTTTIAFVGAILIYLAPFMSWAWLGGTRSKRSGTLFELAAKNKATVGVVSEAYNLHKTVFLFIAIGILICAITLLILSACDYIPALRFLGDLTWVRILSLVVIILLFVLVMTNKTYTNLIHSIENAVKASGGTQDGGRGAGPIFLVSGLVFSLIANISEISSRK